MQGRRLQPVKVGIAADDGAKCGGVMPLRCRQQGEAGHLEQALALVGIHAQREREQQVRLVGQCGVAVAPRGDFGAIDAQSTHPTLRGAFAKSDLGEHALVLLACVGGPWREPVGVAALGAAVGVFGGDEQQEDRGGQSRTPEAIALKASGQYRRCDRHQAGRESRD